MFHLFFKHSLRYFARHRTLTALNILGIALGVTVFVSVQIVNHSALESFKASVDIVAGRANFEVVGDGLRFDERVYPHVSSHPDIEAATPVVEEVCLLPDFAGEYLHILGVDLFTNQPLRTYQIRPPPTAGESGSASNDVLDFVRDPSVIAMTRVLADRLGLSATPPHNEVRLQTQDGVRTFRIGFLLDFDDDAAGADEHIAVMDIASAQENFDHIGLLNRIDARVRAGADAKQIAADLRPHLPGNVHVGPPDRRGSQIERMIGAFQLNLTALSLVALLVGMFLIYNTVAAAVVRRRAEIGLLRALGLTSGQVQALFLGEALLLGALGVALGLLLGVVLAGQLVGAVAKNITSLYILLSIQQLFISPWAVVAAILLALGAVVLAAWFPSREAARIPPVEALALGHLREKAALHTNRWLALGAALLGISALLAVATRAGALPPWLSFGAALACLLGFSFAVPSVCQAFAKLLRPRSMMPRLAVANFGLSLHRNAVTIAALVTALAMVVGITVMIFSFRTTVGAWLNRSVAADIFIAPAANLVVGARETLREETIAKASTIAGIESIDFYREMRPTFQGRPIKIAATRLPVSAAYNRLEFVDGADGQARLRQTAQEAGVVVSEAFERKFGLGRGDLLELATPEGRATLPIKGVFIDYTSETGLVLLDLETYRRLWGDRTVNSMALYLEPAISATQVREELRAMLAPYGQYLVYSNQDLRTQVFRIFDQTFSVTYVLQSIGILISGLGIFLSLIILVGERTRELGVLRAVGASRGQVETMVVLEAALLGLIGAALGLVAGLALALILTYVINVAFFGWTIRWATPWFFLLTLPLWVLAAAVLSALWPARQASGLNIAEAVKME